MATSLRYSLSLLFRIILPTVLFLVPMAGLPVRAAEISLLAGHQGVSDLEISASSGWPPGNVPLGEPGETIVLESGDSGAVSLNWDYQNRTDQKIGFYYSRQGTDFAPAAGLSDASLDISFLHFTGTNFYPQSERLSFFVVAGIGAAFYKPGDATLKEVTRFSAQIGGGAAIRMTENLYLQFDARWLPAFFGGETSIFCSGGCTISVSSETVNQVQLNGGLMFRF